MSGQQLVVGVRTKQRLNLGFHLVAYYCAKFYQLKTIRVYLPPQLHSSFFSEKLYLAKSDISLRTSDAPQDRV
jgi:hypothetical protein